MITENRKSDRNPYPVTRAYMEETDFYARIDEIWQINEERRQLVSAARQRLGLEQEAGPVGPVLSAGR